jgi:uncharacterized membrane protein YqiK
MAIELAEATEIHKNAMKQKTLMVDEQVWQTEKSDMQVANQDIQIMSVEAENARVGAENARVEAKRAGVEAKKARTDLEAIVERDKTLEHESKKT